MSEKVYVVTLKKYEDLDGFYSDMSSDGYKLHMKRPISRNTQYYMTAEQAEEIKKDSRVLDVELNMVDAGLKPIAYNVNNVSRNMTGVFRKGSTFAATDYDWGKLHCAGTDSDRGKNTFGENGTVEFKTATASIFNNGQHVDVVICDNQSSFDCKEWDSPSTNQTRYVQYDWYTQLNGVVGSIDDDGVSIPSAPYTNYFDNATNKSYHGTHVTGTVAGKTYGWANEANIYNMQVLGNAANQGTPVPTQLMFDYLRAFHRYKPINSTTGRRNPTITNHSWGLIVELEAWNMNNIVEIRWRGSSYTQSGNPNPSGWTLNGIEADFGIAPSKNPLPGHSSALVADVEDAIEDGVVVIGAAGNMNCYMVPQTLPDGTQHPDWDNYIWFNNQSGSSVKYISRGSSPNNCQGVVTVGNLSSTSNFKRMNTTNHGPNIDVFAPGDNIVSCFGKPGVIQDSSGNVINGIGSVDTKYGGDNYFYQLTGTSMASPQVAGIAACLATNTERFTNNDLLGYIQKHSKVGDMSFDIGPTPGATSFTFNVNAFNSSEYTITGNDANGAVSGGNPTITCTVNDTLTFIPPPPGSAFCSISAANTSNGYTISWSDRTNWHTGNGQGTNGPANRPTINIEVGDQIDFQNAGFNMNSHPLYIKTTPSVGSGNQVTTGSTYGQGSAFSIGWDTRPQSGPPVIPGTYYYVCGAHSGMGGEIVVHPTGTYYDHPFRIRVSDGGPDVNTPAATNQGANHNAVDGNVQWTPNVPGTYFYQCAMHPAMKGEIIVNSTTGVIGQDGNFADPTCQKESPNLYILCENPRATSGSLQLVLGERVTTLKPTTSRQVFPRTRTFWHQ